MLLNCPAEIFESIQMYIVYNVAVVVRFTFAKVLSPMTSITPSLVEVVVPSSFTILLPEVTILYFRALTVVIGAVVWLDAVFVVFIWIEAIV